jgi:hypothetical protein
MPEFGKNWRPTRSPEASAKFAERVDKLRSALWLIRSIEQRNRTIVRVAESIVKLIFNLNSVRPKSKPGNEGSAKASSPQNPPEESKAPSLESERTDLPASLLALTTHSTPVDTTDRTSLNVFREIIRTSLA